MIPALEEACGEKFPAGTELHTEATGTFLKGLLKKMKVDCSPPLTNARMLDKLVGEFIVRYSLPFPYHEPGEREY